MPVQEKNAGKTQKILIALVIILAAVLLAVLAVMLFSGSGTGPESGGTTATSTPPPSYPDTLILSQPQQTDLLTLTDKLVFAGLSDPREPLLINGIAVARENDGSFSHAHLLGLGRNTVTVTHKDQTLTFTVERRYATERCSPMEAQSYNSGATVYFEVSARYGSTVQVSFAGKEFALTEDSFQEGISLAPGFVLYTGTYKLPSTNLSDRDMGPAVYTVTCDGITETYSSGNLTCLKPGNILASNPSVTPNYGKYIDVGSGYIAQVVTYAGETFDGKTVNDSSLPTNIYLPEGTLDYCSTQEVSLGRLSYVVLRSGQRLYIQKKNNPTATMVQVVDRYMGQLPDHNELSFVSMKKEGRHTVLTLDCLWKAPFYFDIKPQAYQNPTVEAGRNYSITAFTAEYIDITFCYATQFTGSVTVPADSRVFKSAKLISNESDCILRLYLKEKGSFYGWDAYYNDADQLCFRFLEPYQISAADNTVGADLTGTKIVIDVGHGGFDPGTVRDDYKGQEVHESERNMALAKALQKELEAAGATVVLTRETDKRLTVDERNKLLRQEAPDYCISIHHNAIDGYPNYGGFETFYYTPFSMTAAKAVKNRTAEAKLYDQSSLDWHVFFLARQTMCPVVLTENGYMSCDRDLDGILDPQTVNAKALALAKGVADYFLSIRD